MKLELGIKFKLIAYKLDLLVWKVFPDFWKSKKRLTVKGDKSGKRNVESVVISKNYFVFVVVTNTISDPYSIKRNRKKFLTKSLHKLNFEEVNKIRQR